MKRQQRGERTSKDLIIFADDEHELCELFAYALKDAGFNVVTATSAEQVIDIINADINKRVYALVTDIDFSKAMQDDPAHGHIDGFSLVDMLRDKRDDIDIIIMTAHTELAEKTQALMRARVIRQSFDKGAFSPDHVVSFIKNH